MDRISTYASHMRSLNSMFGLQARQSDAEWQVASGKRSETYQGLRLDAARLLDLKAARVGFDRLARTNDAVLRQLDFKETALTAIDGAMRDFRQVLMTAGGNSPLEPVHVQEMQEAAFRALTDVEAFLNTQADGRYLFSGSRVVTKPVDLGLTDLAAFQARYDGLKTHYPPTRDAHLSADLTLTQLETGGLVITNTNTISVATLGQTPPPFAQIAVGATITLSGSGLGNDGVYTVVAKPSADELVVSGPLTLSANATLDVQATLADGSEDPGATLSLGRWYAGDERVATHRVDENRYEELDLNAIDPAFEKALRAFGLIAQGIAETDGGLANHPERIGWAIDLINSALERAPSLPPPFGAELLGNLDDVRRTVGFQRELLHETAQRQTEFVATLEIEIAKTEDISPHEAAARLLDANASLEAAYAAIAKVRNLSLINFL